MYQTILNIIQQNGKLILILMGAFATIASVSGIIFQSKIAHGKTKEQLQVEGKNPAILVITLLIMASSFISTFILEPIGIIVGYLIQVNNTITIIMSLFVFIAWVLFIKAIMRRNTDPLEKVLVKENLITWLKHIILLLPAIYIFYVAGNM